MQRLRYAFDASMARGPSALIAYLGFSVFAVAILFTALILVFGVGPTHNPVTALYDVLLHTIDTGTQANDRGTIYSALDLAVTAAGIVIFSAFIGVLATAIDHRLQELRKGRSRVLESDHTVILGWSDSVFTIVSELAIANESRRRPSIVILAERDKVEMEDALRSRVPDTRGTRIICRTGSPTSLTDLEIVNRENARSVIVLANSDDKEPDSGVIKTILAVVHESAHARFHIVAEILDEANLEAAHLVAADRAVLLNKSRTISRLVVQASRQSGVAAVHQELLDFAGDEIYMRADPALAGRTYRDAVYAYENCTTCGVRRRDGRILLNPPAATAIEPGDSIIAIAEDDSVLDVAASLQASADERAIVPPNGHAPCRQATLVLGWNARTPWVLDELECYAAPGDRLHLVANGDGPPVLPSSSDRGERKLTVTASEGDVTSRATLDRLGVHDYNHVIVMSPSDALDSEHADARALVTLLHLRDIWRRNGGTFTTVSEMADPANRELARVTEVDDVIVSEHMLSLMLAQISENRDLAPVFDELFTAGGCEIYVRPADTYVNAGSEVSFLTFVEAALRRGETAIGYRVAQHSRDPQREFGVVVNPAKSQLVEVRAGDQLIVLAANG